jgi:hypothetical protein
LNKKKVKILLMSIAVFATIGTALALKVAKGNNTLCYVETTVQRDPTVKACPNTIFDTRAIAGVTQYFYITLTAFFCADQTNCINSSASFAG